MKPIDRRGIIQIPMNPDHKLDCANLIIGVSILISQLLGEQYTAESFEEKAQEMLDSPAEYTSQLFSNIAENPEAYMDQMDLSSLRKLIVFGLELQSYIPQVTLKLLQAMQIGLTERIHLRDITLVGNIEHHIVPEKISSEHKISGQSVYNLHTFLLRRTMPTNFDTSDQEAIEKIRGKIKDQSGYELYQNMLIIFTKYPILFLSDLSSLDLLILDLCLLDINRFVKDEEQKPYFKSILHSARLLTRFAYLGALKREEA